MQIFRVDCRRAIVLRSRWCTAVPDGWVILALREGLGEPDCELVAIDIDVTTSAPLHGRVVSWAAWRGDYYKINSAQDRAHNHGAWDYEIWLRDPATSNVIGDQEIGEYLRREDPAGRGVGKPGNPPALGAGDRRFESDRPD